MKVEYVPFKNINFIPLLNVTCSTKSTKYDHGPLPANSVSHWSP